MSRPIKLFHSHAASDTYLCDELVKHLALLERTGMIASQFSRKISLNASIEPELDEHLLGADLILLLISADYMASNYQYNVEMHAALEMHALKQARVIPVLLRPVDDWQSSPLGRLQFLPRDGRPLTTWSNRDEAFVDIARGIREMIQSSSELSPTTPEGLTQTSPRGDSPFQVPTRSLGPLYVEAHVLQGDEGGVVAVEALLANQSPRPISIRRAAINCAFERQPDRISFLGSPQVTTHNIKIQFGSYSSGNARVALRGGIREIGDAWTKPITGYLLPSRDLTELRLSFPLYLRLEPNEEALARFMLDEPVHEEREARSSNQIRRADLDDPRGSWDQLFNTWIGFDAGLGMPIRARITGAAPLEALVTEWGDRIVPSRRRA